jgi:hypothetical protein
MWMSRLLASGATLVVAAVGAIAAPPVSTASAQSFCGDLGGDWDGHYCHTAVFSPRKATRDIKMAVPDGLVERPEIREYLHNLFTNWKTKGATMVQDSFGEENYEIFPHGDALSVVFHEDYHADGPWINNAYRTFSYDGSGRQLQLADITKPGVDPLTAIPPLAEPYIVEALDQAHWEHEPGTYPFVLDRWTPDKPFGAGYKAWAITPDELILYLPDYPVGHDSPIRYGRFDWQFSMDGGTVEPHIPLAALSSILRPEYGGT